MSKGTVTAQVYRFTDRAAINLRGQNGIAAVAYMTAPQVRELAKALLAVADEIDAQPDFCKSTFGSTEFVWRCQAPGL